MATKEDRSLGYRPEPARREADVPGMPRRTGRTGDQKEANKLIVGRDICMSGDITACDTLVVEGTVEATLTDSRIMQIAESGQFTGKADIDVAEVRGHFEGELTARERLVIHASGQISGKIRYGDIQIERGGKIAGEVEVIIPEVRPQPTRPEPQRVEPQKPVEVQKEEAAELEA